MIQSLTEDVPQLVLPFVTIYIFKKYYSKRNKVLRRSIRILLAVTSFTFLLRFSIEFLIAEDWIDHISAKIFSLSFTIICGIQVLSCHSRSTWYITFASDLYFLMREFSQPVVFLGIVRLVLVAFTLVLAETGRLYQKEMNSSEEEAQNCSEASDESEEDAEDTEEQIQGTGEETRLLDSASEAQDAR
ncbi:hypothetical protein BKA56DRAFT_626100 [Ilyonectria sp. MPI-CAGE-AT-0026]|nr:hypothetical protein BKA56DRAFT_626100 [Ilyonectria sp. MPI-CAGE-AT-0026]